MRPEESLCLTGDQNLIELNTTVHYDLTHPDDFLLRQMDGEATVRAAAEAAMLSIITILVWVPAILAAPRTRLPWTAFFISWAITAAVWVVAQDMQRQQAVTTAGSHRRNL